MLYLYSNQKIKTMWHSVKLIAKRYSEISKKRKDKKLFIYENFINFAKENKNKYQLQQTTDEDLLVSTWNSDDLISDYKKTL